MNIIALDDIDATPDEKRASQIAADFWGVNPVRFDDGDAHPLLREVWIKREDKKMKGKLRRFGVLGYCTTLPNESVEEGGWTPVHLADGKPVMQGGRYRFVEDVGLVLENCETMYDDLPAALLKTLDFERNGTPKERPHRLGVGPAIDLEAWRSEFAAF